MDANCGVSSHTVGELALKVGKRDFAVFFSEVICSQLGQDFAAIFCGKAGLCPTRRGSATRVVVPEKVDISVDGREAMLPVYDRSISIMPI